MATEDVDEGQRNPVDLSLFALGFISVISVAVGIVILSAKLAFVGALLFLFSVGYFFAQPE